LDDERGGHRGDVAGDAEHGEPLDRGVSGAIERLTRTDVRQVGERSGSGGHEGRGLHVGAGKERAAALRNPIPRRELQPSLRVVAAGRNDSP
jgi:hypothetical protein